MMANAKTFQTTLKGVRLRSTPQYAKLMNFDRVIDLVVGAIRAADKDRAHRTDDGKIEWKYTARVKSTMPYRTLRVNPHWTPGTVLNVVDTPAGGHSGLVTLEFENYHLIEGVTLKTARARGGIKMLYQSLPPSGWGGRDED